MADKRTEPDRKREDHRMSHGMPAEIRDTVATLMRNEQRLYELGFAAGNYGEWSALNCRVTLYAVGDKWEIDILLPNGSAVGCDVPISEFAGRTRAEINEWKKANRLA
jgi:hypothetical protein